MTGTPAQPQFPTRIQGSADFGQAFGVSRETMARLETFARLLVLWQRSINLIAPSTVPALWHRHMADSAQLLRLAPSDAKCWLDIGSGGGFPGVVIAIMLAETVRTRVVLVESDQRKAAFLREVVRETGLAPLGAVDIIVERIESAANRTRIGQVDVVSARAVAPLSQLMQLSEPYFGAATVGLFSKGRDVAAELRVAEAGFSFESALKPSLTDAQAQIVLVRKLRSRV